MAGFDHVFAEHLRSGGVVFAVSNRGVYEVPYIATAIEPSSVLEADGWLYLDYFELNRWAAGMPTDDTHHLEAMPKEVRFLARLSVSAQLRVELFGFDDEDIPAEPITSELSIQAQNWLSSCFVESPMMTGLVPGGRPEVFSDNDYPEDVAFLRSLTRALFDGQVSAAETTTRLREYCRVRFPGFDVTFHTSNRAWRRSEKRLLRGASDVRDGKRLSRILEAFVMIDEAVRDIRSVEDLRIARGVVGRILERDFGWSPEFWPEIVRRASRRS